MSQISWLHYFFHLTYLFFYKTGKQRKLLQVYFPCWLLFCLEQFLKELFLFTVSHVSPIVLEFPPDIHLCTIETALAKSTDVLHVLNLMVHPQPSSLLASQNTWQTPAFLPAEADSSRLPGHSVLLDFLCYAGHVSLSAAGSSLFSLTTRCWVVPGSVFDSFPFSDFLHFLDDLVFTDYPYSEDHHIRSPVRPFSLTLTTYFTTHLTSPLGCQRDISNSAV